MTCYCCNCEKEWVLTQLAPICPTCYPFGAPLTAEEQFYRRRSVALLMQQQNVV